MENTYNTLNTDDIPIDTNLDVYSVLVNRGVKYSELLNTELNKELDKALGDSNELRKSLGMDIDEPFGVHIVNVDK
ncbi:hypothetical protein [Paraclostridium bifermentans]|uniref:hypothetical protein n=1 Tax=Paraclostridium bifermentans TaxID=1490 RepID=UPI00374F5B15